MLFTLAFVLVQALAIQASIFKDAPGSDIEALCAGKNIELTSFSQLRELGVAVGTSACSITLKHAIPELVSVIEQGKEDLCSVHSIDTLRGYYAKYLDTSAHTDKEKLPKSLKRFVLAYGMQMSNLCKKNMVKVLTEEGHQLLTAEDFAQVESLTGDEGPVAEVLGAMEGPDEVFMPGDLAPFLKRHGVESKQVGSEKVFLQAHTNGMITKLQSVCQHRFKPVYEPLMVSLVRLANMGFNYKDETLRSELKSPAVVREVGQWSRIVFMCEALGGIHIVEDQGDNELAQGTESKLVRIITKEEAAAIEGASVNSDDSEIDHYVYQPSSRVTLGDLIYDQSDKKLLKAIKSVKTSRSEEDMIRRRMSSKGFSIIKNQLKQGHVGFIVSATYKSALRKHHGSAVIDPSEQLVKTLDEMVERQNGGARDGKVSMSTMGNIIGQLVLGIIALGLICLGTWGIIALSG